MRYLWIISTYLLLIVVLAACQPANPAAPVPEDIEAKTVIPESTLESPQTQPSTPVSTPEDTDMISPIPLDASAQKLVTLVKEHLAQQLGIPVDQIALLEVKPAVWRDASLGCPKPAIDYMPMETPGFNIILKTGERTYSYHTDQTKRFVVCNRP